MLDESSPVFPLTYLTYGPGDDDVVFALWQPKLQTVFGTVSCESPTPTLSNML